VNFRVHSSPSDISLFNWRFFLKKSKTANFFHTPEAFEFYKNSKVGEPFFFAVTEHDSLVGLFVGLIFAESGLKSSFSRRAICFGGPVLDDSIEESALHLLLETALHILQEKSIYIEIRNFNDYSNYKNKFLANGFEYHAHLNFHVDCSNRESMEKRISSSKMRQIRKSFNEGAEIIEADSINQVRSFYCILKELYEAKVKTPIFPEDFFIQFLRQGLGKYLLVQYQGKIIGGIMCPIFESQAIYEWYVCGNDREYKNIYPSTLATWAAMDYANKHGILRFDFMGAGRPNENYGVREFKSRFGGELVEHGRFLYLCRPWLYRIGKFAIEMLKRR